MYMAASFVGSAETPPFKSGIGYFSGCAERCFSDCMYMAASFVGSAETPPFKSGIGYFSGRAERCFSDCILPAVVVV